VQASLSCRHGSGQTEAKGAEATDDGAASIGRRPDPVRLEVESNGLARHGPEVDGGGSGNERADADGGIAVLSGQITTPKLGRRAGDAPHDSEREILHRREIQLYRSDGEKYYHDGADH
jgi:hypothetical protein